MARSGRERRDQEEEEAAVVSVERVFEGRVVPGWKEQVTLRALSVSALLGAMFSVIVMKLNLTTGIIPSLNVSAGLLGFFLLTSWTKLLDKAGVASVRPFTRQENTVVQTCVVACASMTYSGTPPRAARRRALASSCIASSIDLAVVTPTSLAAGLFLGGFGSYLLAMDRKTAEKTSTGDDSSASVSEPEFGRMMAFFFLVSFVGLLAIVPMRKVRSTNAPKKKKKKKKEEEEIIAP